MASGEGESLKQNKNETSQTNNSLWEPLSDQEEHARTEVQNRQDISDSSPSPDDTQVKEVVSGDLGGGDRSSHHHPPEITRNERRKGIQETGACSDTLDGPFALKDYSKLTSKLQVREKVEQKPPQSRLRREKRKGERCTQLEMRLRCRGSKYFWESVKGSKCCEKIWLNVRHKLSEKFPEVQAQARVFNLLKALLDVKHSTDVVKFHKFVRLERIFGPFRPETDGPGCVILRQLENLVKNSTSKDGNSKKRKKSWFAGYMSRGDAIARLDGKPPGTFLVRISETEAENGSFSLDIVMLDKEIEQFLLEGNPEKAANSDAFSLHLSVNVGGCERTFPSLPELVKYYQTQEELFCIDKRDNGTMCITVCPDLPFNHIINGYSE